MKIGQNARPFVDMFGLRDDSKAGDVKSPAFQDLFQQAGLKLSRGELDKLMRQIDDLGRIMSRQMTWRALQDYKERVRRFLEQVVKGGFAAKEQQGFDRRGRVRLYKVVSQIDGLMAELAEQVLAEEKDHIEILSKIGDIRGLLMNLYY